MSKTSTNKWARVLQPLVLLGIVGGIFVLYKDNFAVAKIVHLLALISWFAGLFYLPRLFVYHAMATETAVKETFKVMEYKLFHYIMQPAAVLTLGAGIWMLALWNWALPKWMHWKLTMVVLLVIYHFLCWKIVGRFRRDENQRGHVFYRWFNEVPTILLIGVVILVILKPGG